MNFSESTLKILKNFSEINPGIVFRKGVVQSTISPSRNIWAEAEIEEDLPVKVGVSDLKVLLSNLSLMKSPSINMTEQATVISDDSLTLTLTAAEPKNIPHPAEDKTINMINPEHRFDLTEGNLIKLMKFAAINKWPTFTIFGLSGRLNVRLHDSESDTSGSAALDIGEYQGEEFSVSIKVSNMTVIPDDYLVEVKTGKFVKFTSKNRKLIYFISLNI